MIKLNIRNIFYHDYECLMFEVEIYLNRILFGVF